MENASYQPSASDVDSRWTAFHSRIEIARDEYAVAFAATRLYALVDTRELPELRHALEQIGNAPFHALWDGTDLSAHKEISPLLIMVDLGASDPALPLQLLKRLWRFSEDGFMVSWIWSPYQLDDVAKHLRGYCEYTLPDRRAFYLHFYDNRILERLRQVWTPEEQTDFASVGFSIWYRNRARDECIWGNAELPRMEFKPTQTMTEEQHLALLDFGVADKIALQIATLVGARLDHLSAEELYRAVHEQVERAARYRINDERDMLTYVFKGLFVSPHFDERPSIQAQLERASIGRASFSDVLSSVDEPQ
jgi:hypothetical protein